jgi:hypothetical protein
MDALMRISREAQIVLACTAVYVILSFFDWQSSGSYGANEWDSVGVFAALLAVVMLVWELGRAFDSNLSLGSLDAPTVSFLLALGLLFFTISAIIVLSYLSWPAWLGLVLSIFVTFVAYVRAQNEEMALPKFAVPTSVGRTTATAPAAPPADPPPAAAEPAPAAPEPPAEETAEEHSED